MITNLDTGEKSEEFYNKEFGPKFDEEKMEYRNWASLPFYIRLFKNKPKFKYYDGKH